jgi:hypothetical protein
MRAEYHAEFHVVAPLAVQCVAVWAGQLWVPSLVAAEVPGEAPRSVPLPPELRGVSSVECHTIGFTVTACAEALCITNSFFYQI